MTSPHKETQLNNHDQDHHENPFYEPSTTNSYPTIDPSPAPVEAEAPATAPSPSSSPAVPPPSDDDTNKRGTSNSYPTIDPSPVAAPVEAEAVAPATAPSPSSSSATPAVPPPSDDDTKKWGTHVMGAPAVPTVHPDNQKAASSWTSAGLNEQPYVQFSPVDHKPLQNPFEPVIHMFSSWTTKADTISRNVWHHLKTGQSVPCAAWGKMNLTAKTLTSGGFESHFKQIFDTDPNEKLLKTFACYLSTSTGPVAGTIYLSTARLAFCSDRPLSFAAPSGQEAWSYYKVIVPLGNVGTVNPVVMKQNPPEKYIQIVTVDGHDFWFMGFVNYEKACHHLLNSVSDFRAAEHGSQAPVHTQKVD